MAHSDETGRRPDETADAYSVRHRAECAGSVSSLMDSEEACVLSCANAVLRVAMPMAAERIFRNIVLVFN